MKGKEGQGRHLSSDSVRHDIVKDKTFMLRNSHEVLFSERNQVELRTKYFEKYPGKKMKKHGVMLIIMPEY